MLIMQVNNNEKEQLKLVLKSEFVPVDKRKESILDIKIG